MCVLVWGVDSSLSQLFRGEAEEEYKQEECGPVSDGRMSLGLVL